MSENWPFILLIVLAAVALIGGNARGREDV